MTRTRANLTAPVSFRLFAPSHTQTECEAHYGVGDHVIRRWSEQTGVKCHRITKANGPVARMDCSIAARAVRQCLQRYGEIFRCTPTGARDPNGSHWNRNGFILTDDDVIDRAHRNGWSPTDWERIAA